MSFEDGVGFSWEERVATGIPGRGVTCPLARSWERAEYMGVTAAVGLGGGRCVWWGEVDPGLGGGGGRALTSHPQRLRFRCN